MPINKSTKTAFVHIPRNGGTYIEHIMGVHVNRPDSGLGTNYNHSGDLCHLFGRNLQHLTFQEMLTLLGKSSYNYRWFSVLRDPKERLISVLCHTMGCPQSTCSFKALLICIIKVIFILFKFHIKSFLFCLYIKKHYQQVMVNSPKIQHLNQQWNYIFIEDKINMQFDYNRPKIEVYPFEALNEMHLFIPSLNVVSITGKRPNASKNNNKPSSLNDFIIRIFAYCIWPKDRKLFQLVSQRWKRNKKPFIV